MSHRKKYFSLAKGLQTKQNFFRQCQKQDLSKFDHHFSKNGMTFDRHHLRIATHIKTAQETFGTQIRKKGLPYRIRALMSRPAKE